MRTKKDRLRHAVLYEIIAFVIIVPLYSFALSKPMTHFGMLAIVISLIATVWNMVWNWVLDKILHHRHGTTEKRQHHRFIQTLVYEGVLVFFTMPLIAFSLQMTFWEALATDLSMVVFFLIYNYIYNLGYDKVFPDMELAG